MPPRSRGRQSSGPQSVKQLSSPPRPLWRLPPSSITPTPTPRPASQWMLRTRQLAGSWSKFSTVSGVQWPSSPRSFQRPSGSTVLLIVSSWPSSLQLSTFATTLRAFSLPSSLIISPLPLPLPVLLSAHPVRRVTCPLLVSFPPMCYMSVEKTTLSLMHSPDPTSLPSPSPPLTIVNWLPIKLPQRKLPPTKLPLQASALTMSSLMAALSSAMFPWVNLGRWSLESGQRGSSMPFTALPMPAAARRSGPSPHASYGMG